MTSDNFFKLFKGNEFRFSNFKEIKEEDLKNADAETKRLFNIFAGDDHILQTNEAQRLWNKIQTAAATNKKGDNSVFDNDEMQRFLNKDKDIKATKTKFSLDALANVISQVFEVRETQETQQPILPSLSLTDEDLVQYTPEEIENISVQTLFDDVSNARRLYDTQNNEQGSVSKFVNATKETFDTEFASSRVGRYIRKEELCVDLLECSKSEEGLSQKEYLEAKIDFVISLIQDLEQYFLRTEITQDAINISLKTLTFGILGNKKSKNSQELETQKAELDKLKSILATLKPEEIDFLISKLLSINEKPEDNSNFNISFGGKSNVILKHGTIKQSKKEDKITNSFSPDEYKPQADKGSLASLSNAEAYRKMTFEEVFQEERCIAYNTEAVMDYTKKNSYTQFLLGIHNRREQLADMLKEARFIKQTQALGSEQMPGEIQNNARVLMGNLTNALKIVCGNDANKVQELIDSIYPNNNNGLFSITKKPEVITNEKGEFVSLKFDIEFETTTIHSKNGQSAINLPSFGSNIDGFTIDSMITIADKLQENINTTYEKALNGKTIEQYSEEVKQAYTKAYGAGNAEDIANACIQSQQEGVGYVKTGVSTIGMAVMIAGQLVPVGGQVAAAMVYGGLLTATLGSSAITATELLTKEGKVTKEELQELAKEVATSLALTATGMKIGKISEGVYLAVAKHCPKLIALAAEIGSDATMSLVADLAITGQIDLSGEGIAQLQGVLVGILHAKGNFKTYLETHAGKVKAGESTQTEYRNSQESAILSRLETANDRESFVAIRNEIKKMPACKEKTQLIKEYLKKYNEWSASPERPNIRMQHMLKGNGNNNLHLKQINFDWSVFTTEEISLNLTRIEKKYGAKIEELLEFDEYATEIIGELQKAVAAKNYSFAIEENGIFTPYKLSLMEIHEIKSALVADINGHIDINKIDMILRENNPELFDRYGSAYKYSDQLNQLSKTLSNLDMYDGVIPKKDLGIEINGNRKYIRTSENIPKGTVKNINYTELIESNMLTLESIRVLDEQGIEIPENKKLRTYNTAYKTNSKTETITLDIETVINKAKVEGIGALSSFEIHALTDTFVDLFNSNGKFQTALKNKSMNKANTIYSYVSGIKSEANRILQGSNLEIRDHCIMRMIDRDVYSVVNNKVPGTMVSFTNMIKTIKERATALIKENQKSGKTDFSFIIYEFGGGGLEIKIKFISNGKYEIDAIIQK